VAHPVLAGNEKKYVNECLDEGWISSSGKFAGRFEASFADFCRVQHAVACTNGTAGLHIALLAAGVGPGDEVIVPALTYVSAPNVVRYCGARPVLADSEPRTMNIDPDQIEALITPRTRGIIVAHLYGHAADMEPICTLARRHGLFVVEDAAEAHGAEYRGRRAGALADMAVFSFFANKIVTTGEGGMVTTQSDHLNSRLRRLRGQGVDPERRYWFPEIGYNYRMTNIQAAIGLAQMEQVDSHLARRREIAGWYDRHLAPLAGLISLPVEEPWARHAFWMYTILLDSGIDRDTFMSALLEDGIETRPVFHPMHLMPPYREPDGTYPVAEDLARRGVTLPTHGLLAEEDIAYIARSAARACRAKAGIAVVAEVRENATSPLPSCLPPR
jgi:perosamine synthetase